MWNSLQSSRPVSLPIVCCFVLSMAAPTYAGLIAWSPDARIKWHDDFEDNDVTDFSDDGVWHISSPDETVVRRVESGGFYVSSDQFIGMKLDRWDHRDVGARNDWSFASLLTIHSGVFAGVGTTRLDHAAILPGGSSILRGGNSGDNSVLSGLPNLLGKDVLVRMNLFDGNVEASAWLIEGGFPTFLGSVEHPVVPGLAVPMFGIGNSNDVETSVTFLDAWISDQPIEVVPEPSAIGLACCALLAVVFGRRIGG